VGFESRYPVLTYLYFGIQIQADTPNPENLPQILDIFSSELTILEANAPFADL
jgi:hypothetical protein